MKKRKKTKNVQKFNFYLHFITISQLFKKNRKKTFFFRLIYIYLHSANQKLISPPSTFEADLDDSKTKHEYTYKNNP